MHEGSGQRAEPGGRPSLLLPGGALNLRRDPPPGLYSVFCSGTFSREQPPPQLCAQKLESSDVLSATVLLPQGLSPGRTPDLAW